MDAERLQGIGMGTEVDESGVVEVIEQGTEPATIDDLNRKGYRKVRVVREDRIKEMVLTVVRALLEKRIARIREEERSRVQAEIERLEARILDLESELTEAREGAGTAVDVADPVEEGEADAPEPVAVAVALPAAEGGASAGDDVEERVRSLEIENARLQRERECLQEAVESLLVLPAAWDSGTADAATVERADATGTEGSEVVDAEPVEAAPVGTAADPAGTPTADLGLKEASEAARQRVAEAEALREELARSEEALGVARTRIETLTEALDAEAEQVSVDPKILAELQGSIEEAESQVRAARRNEVSLRQECLRLRGVVTGLLVGRGLAGSGEEELPESTTGTVVEDRSVQPAAERTAPADGKRGVERGITPEAQAILDSMEDLLDPEPKAGPAEDEDEEPVAEIVGSVDPMESEETVAVLVSLRDRLQRTIDRRHTESARLREEVAALRGEVEAAPSPEVAAEVESLRAERDEIVEGKERAETAAKRAWTKVNDLEAEVKRLREVATKAEAIETELAPLREQASELESLRKEHVSVVSAKEKAEAEGREAVARAAAIEGTVAELETKSAEVDDSRKRLEEELVALRSRAEEAEGKVAHLAGQLRDLKGKTQALLAERDNDRSSRQEEDAHLREIEEVLRSQSDALTEAQRRAQGLESQIGRVKQERQAAQERLTGLRSALLDIVTGNGDDDTEVNEREGTA